MSRTFLAASVDSNQVVGFYTLKVVEIAHNKQRLPGVLLARFAVDSAFQGRGVGGRMMLNAFEQIVLTSPVLALVFVLVDPKDEIGAGFYEKYGFKRLASNQNRMYLDIRQIQKYLDLYA